jgi:hypothetical protein
MIPPAGEYRYEILAAGQVVAVEEARLDADRLRGVRTTKTGTGRYEVDAQLGQDRVVTAIVLRYERGPFSRSADYRADGDLLRGSVGALAGPVAAETRLGRYREVDADLVLFKALIIAHARSRGTTRFTGRIARIDPNTLVAVSRKETYRQRDSAGLRWVCEPLLGESEEIDLDEQGRIVRCADRRGAQTLLRSFRAAD